MTSLSFDPVAAMYDATRGYPPEVAQAIAAAIATAAEATRQTRFLEVGVGTGRIAFPLASSGHIYTGVDISEKMLGVLEGKLIAANWQEQTEPWGTFPDENAAIATYLRRFILTQKLATMRAVRGDITALPFTDHAFDVVLGVHIFHLVDGWQKAIEEVLRVARPGGLFLHCWDRDVQEEGTEPWSVEGKWRDIVRELGGQITRVGAATARADVEQLLRARGLQPEEIATVRWDSVHTPRQALENVTKRLWSGTWRVPDALFAESVERLQQWADEYFAGRFDTLLPRQRVFMISRTRID